MRNLKRLAAAVLAAALALSLAALPASAAPGSFTDISDADTALNADILRLMGVVSGTGSDNFNPAGTLTRAQFCTMLVTFLQKKDEASRYATRTIFSDVKSDHWARSYINLAASISVADGEGEGGASIPLVSGIGDGRFLPDNSITIAEAATILLRALGYTSKEAGAVWPQGYLNLAASVGLTEGLDLPAGTAISRAQAARLFVNALSCKTKEGKVYYKTLGASLKEKTIILAVGVETDDGSSAGAIRTTSNANSEAYLPAHGDGNPTSLQGRRGDLVLDENDQIITFVPDESTATTIVLNGDAQAAYVKAGGGKQYTISSDALVFLGSDQEGKSWLDSYKSLTAGTQITMYSEKGKIVAVYSTTSTTTIDSDAVVVMGDATAATFRGLTGGATSFNIVKDRQPIRISQIKPYDVVTYDKLSNTLTASSLRITATYEGGKPNAKTPTEISILGTKFDVLKSAWDTLGGVKAGDSVSLLLTADGKVGGIVPATFDTRSTAIGVVSGGSVSIYLPNGSTMSLGSVSGRVPEGQPVVVTAGKNAFQVSSLSGGSSGDLNLDRMTMGAYTVSPGVRVYEKVDSGNTVALNWDDLAMESIPADHILAYHVNSANLVDYIVFDDVTGNAYLYGMMVSVTTSGSGDSREQSWTLRRGSEDVKFSAATGYRGSSGSMVGVVLGSDQNGANMIRKVIALTAIRNVKDTDFFESEGDPYVTVAGRTYRISGSVECFYNRAGYYGAKENWLTGSGADRLTSIQGYSHNFTIYIDPVGQQVRVIVAH